MDFPNHLKYTADHEWVELDGTTATVGITEFAQGELGDIVYVEVGTVGKTLAKGEVFGSVEAVKTVSDLYMPVSGKVLELNPELEHKPELVNTAPYKGGWMVRIELTNPSETDALLTADAYEETLG